MITKDVFTLIVCVSVDACERVSNPFSSIMTSVTLSSTVKMYGIL